MSGNISNSATTADVAATTGWPTSFPFVIAIDFGAANEELVSVTNNVSDTLTITRGFGGTSAVAHSTGAVVRHVYNAVDATDFRTHEDATTGVHGVTGDIVGTTATQTLSNKTLTAPTVNGGALSGTFTGAPTFSGAVVLSGTPSISTGAALAGTFSGTPDFSGNFTASGTPTFNNQALARRTFATGATFRTSVTGDSTDRFYMEAGGKLNWGSGAAAVDTNLYRSAADNLKTDDVFSAQVETTTSGATASGPDWTLVSFNGRRTCGVTSVWVVVNRAGATLTGDSQGNILDETMVTLPSGWRPPVNTQVIFDRGGVNLGGATIQTDGLCVLKMSVPNGTVLNGANVSFCATWVA